MDRAIRFLLLGGLILSSIAALTAAVRILVGFMAGTEWYWAGAVAAYCGPLGFAAALYVFDRSGRRANA